jgi:N-dimethylarginine dimethylaminohydrolase
MTSRPIHRVKERKHIFTLWWRQLQEALSLFSHRTAVIAAAFLTQATKTQILCALHDYETVVREEDTVELGCNVMKGTECFVSL